MSSGVAPWVQRVVGGSACRAPLTIEHVADEQLLGKGGFALTSPAFSNGGELDPSFTAGEEDAVAPPLEWTAPPQGTQELVLLVEDADAPSGKTQVHWSVWGLAAQKGKLLEGETPPRTGKNAAGNSEWLLPDPPRGEERRYVFQLFAVDLPLTLMPGAMHDDLLSTLRGHVIGAAVLTARFTGQEADEWDDEADDDEF